MTADLWTCGARESLSVGAPMCRLPWRHDGAHQFGGDEMTASDDNVRDGAGVKERIE